MTGEQAGDSFSVVASAGDVNGDGFDDVLVGAPGGNYAKLYFGGAPFDTLADLRFVSQQGSEFGYSIAGGGDVNGDGFTDILVGMPGYNTGPPNYFPLAGKVYLYLSLIHI